MSVSHMYHPVFILNKLDLCKEFWLQDSSVRSFYWPFNWSHRLVKWLGQLQASIKKLIIRVIRRVSYLKTICNKLKCHYGPKSHKPDIQAFLETKSFSTLIVKQLIISLESEMHFYAYFDKSVYQKWLVYFAKHFFLHQFRQLHGFTFVSCE